MNTLKMFFIRVNYLKAVTTSIFLLLFSLGMVFAQEGADAPDQATLDLGKKIFEGNCESCHGLGTADVVGPGLKGILDRRDRKWLIPWIKNSAAVIASGDKYANDLFKKYNNTAMNSFETLSDEEINAVITFVNIGETKQKPETATTPGGGKEEVVGTDSGALSNYFNILLGVLLIVLILILIVLVLMISVLKKYLNQREDIEKEDQEVVNQKFNIGKLFQNRVFLGGIALIFVLIVAKGTIDSLLSIGVQQGYAPNQPIPFSHKLHAGQYEIDCGYCHTGVYKGKSATIPTANICMNCHNTIKRDAPDIQKIYKAIENDRPIEWVRIHNLPDLAYFNHSQHTNVAGLECERCHGEIKEMEVVEQRAPLTMGWCINCHRETVVSHAKDNEYYDRLLEAHKDKDAKMTTVENIGGLECSKCHY